MFNLNKNVQVDGTGVQSKFLNKIRAGVGVTAMALGGMSVPISQNNEPIQKDNETSLNYFLKDSNSATDLTHKTEYNNAIFIVITNTKRKGKTGKDITEIDTGSGTIIADSKNGGLHNGILTAGHVAGFNFDSDGDSIGNKTVCDGRPGYLCYAYDSQGNPLGKLSLRQTHSDILNDENLSTRINHDSVVMDITPINDRFDKIQGAPLAKEQSQVMMKAPVDKSYSFVNTDGKMQTVEVGMTPGASGGGVYNSKGEIIGVVSMNDHMTMEKDGMVADFRDASHPDIGYTYAKNSIFTDVAKNHEIKGDNIQQENIQQVMDKTYKSQFDSKNYGLFAPIGDSQLLKSLGNAGKGIKTVQSVKGDISIIGFPNGSAMEYETKLDEEKRFDCNMGTKLTYIDNNKKEDRTAELPLMY